MPPAAAEPTACINSKLFALYLDSFVNRTDAAALCTAKLGAGATLAAMDNAAEWDLAMGLVRNVSRRMASGSRLVSPATCHLHPATCILHPGHKNSLRPDQ